MRRREVHGAPLIVSLLNVPKGAVRPLPTDAGLGPGARTARARRPFFVLLSGPFNSVCACRIEKPVPKRTPLDLTPLIRVIPAAISGASRPLSAASTASLARGVIRALIKIELSPRASNATRQALGVALVKPGRGS
jgi:hypothetical protein